MGDRAPEKRRVVYGVAAFGALLGYFWVGPLGILLGAVVVLVSAAEMFLPIRYRLDGEEARSQIGLSVTAIRWENVKRLIQTDEGVRLSPLSQSSRLDAFRGVYLRFSGNEAEVLAKIAELRRDGRTLDSGPDSGGGAAVGGESGA